MHNLNESDIVVYTSNFLLYTHIVSVEIRVYFHDGVVCSCHALKEFVDIDTHDIYYVYCILNYSNTLSITLHIVNSYSDNVYTYCMEGDKWDYLPRKN
jgi:hypothetical protein